jgi:Phytanoyl-CoA dioxygenase (PhyH)
MMTPTAQRDFAETGFEIVAGLIGPKAVQSLLAELTRLRLPPLRGGIRRIDQRLPAVAALAHSEPFVSAAGRHLNGPPALVRAIYFDKSPANNWFVTWHQDRTVAVSERFAAEGWNPWSLKAGAWHVQPPLAVLEQMVTIRLHLDDATASNGCLKVLPGSHKLGLLGPEETAARVNASRAVPCVCAAGEAVIMRPHILHASDKSSVAQPRRILHLEYSSYRLPEGIHWNP